MDKKSPKVYVEVTVLFDIKGGITPIEVIWEDDRRFEITQVTDIRKAASMKAGGCGIRYECVINGKKTFLFLEEDRWLVERR